MQIQGVLPEFTLSKTEGVEMTIEPKQGFTLLFNKDNNYQNRENNYLTEHIVPIIR